MCKRKHFFIETNMEFYDVFYLVKVEGCMKNNIYLIKRHQPQELVQRRKDYRTSRSCTYLSFKYFRKNRKFHAPKVELRYDKDLVFSLFTFHFFSSITILILK
jgi:hypothetical protein